MPDDIEVRPRIWNRLRGVKLDLNLGENPQERSKSRYPSAISESKKTEMKCNW